MAAGMMETLFVNLAQSIGGNGATLGALLFILFAYIAYKTHLPISGLVFIGILALGVMVVLGIVDLLVYVAVLVGAAILFWLTATRMG